MQKPTTLETANTKPATIKPSTAKPANTKPSTKPVSKQTNWKSYSRGSSYQKSSYENCCSRESSYCYQMEKIALITVIVSKPSRCTSCERQSSRIGNENSSNVRPSSKGSLHVIWITLLQRELQSYYSFQVTKCPRMVIVVLLVSENNYFHSWEGVWW